MRLIKCHIENFGKLQNFDYEFSEGLNTIKQINGFGKTTFAHFIKAMLYGLPSTTKKNISQNIRKKYTPWQGGVFGGYIEILIDEKVYRVERFFGSKESEDVFKMIDLQTGKQTQKYTSNLGEELFGVDADGYERSTYIPEEKLEQKPNESLQNRLTSVLHGSDNSESLSVAIQVLDKKKAELKNRQNKGLIPELDEKIDQTNQEIDRLKLNYKELDKLDLELKKHYEKLNDLKEKQSVVKQDIKTFNDVQRKIESQKYIQENSEKLQKYKQIIAKNDEILNNNEEFAEIIDEFQAKNNRKEEIKTKINAIKETSKLEKEKALLEEYFKGQKPSKVVLEKLIEKEKENRDREHVSFSKPVNKKIPIILLAIAILSLIVGAVLVSNYLGVAIVLFVVSFATLCAAGFIYFKQYIELKTGGQAVRNEDENYQAVKAEINAFIKTTCESSSEQNIALNNIKQKLEQYEAVCIEFEKENAIIDKLENEYNKLNDEISSFIEKFKINKNENPFDQIKNAYKEKLKVEKDIEEIQKKLDQTEYLETLDAEVFDRFKNKNIDDILKEEKDLQKEIYKVNASVVKLNATISALNNEIDEIDSLEGELNLYKEQRAEYLQEYRLVEQTKKFLSQANDSLTSRYIKPMYDGLTSYLSKITDEDLKVQVDTNLNVNLEYYSSLKELEQMSAGYKTIINLSMRLALINAIFNKEKPFIVLDDPFVNLDEKKTEKALELIKEISKEYQIVYLVCHKSRI